MRCFFCGKSDHEGFKCSLISAYEYDNKQRIRRIEFVTFVDLIGMSVQAEADVPPGTTVH